jgi:hypothetical protein
MAHLLSSVFMSTLLLLKIVKYCKHVLCHQDYHMFGDSLKGLTGFSMQLSHQSGHMTAMWSEHNMDSKGKRHKLEPAGIHAQAS